MPSRGSALAQAVARITFSPERTTALPCACLAQLPVSNEIFLPPLSSTVTSCFIAFLLSSETCFSARNYGGNGFQTHLHARLVRKLRGQEVWRYLRMPSFWMTFL